MDGERDVDSGYRIDSVTDRRNMNRVNAQIQFHFASLQLILFLFRFDLVVDQRQSKLASAFLYSF